MRFEQIDTDVFLYGWVSVAHYDKTDIVEYYRIVSPKGSITKRGSFEEGQRVLAEMDLRYFLKFYDT